MLQKVWQSLPLRKTYLILMSICAAYAALTLGNMTRWSIWFDEAFSAYLMRFSFAEITHYTAQDVHPPLYYWLLKAWTEVFGMSELAVRSLSMVFGIIAIIGVYLLVQRLFRSPTWALWAAAIVAFSPLVIRFGHETRMYTLVLAIVIWASYVLVRMSQKRPATGWWMAYGLLLAAGMLTHYYVALAWLAHWVWRYLEKRASRIKQFWSRPWLWSHILAIGLFAWWLPTAIRQFTSVQSGFWIPAVGAYTPVDYLSNLLLYQQYGATTGWWALVLVLTLLAGLRVIKYGYGYLRQRSAQGSNLLISLAAVPPLLLVVLSMPPLTSTFMDRYILYAQAALMIFVTLSAVALYEKLKTKRATVHGLAVMLLICAVIGIANVYYYGNYNKNSNTSVRVKEVMQQIDQSSGGNTQPVIADNSWVYYEAAFYHSDNHPVYFLDSRAEDYRYGSLEMLKDAEREKITDIHEFARHHRYVWYLGSRADGDIEPPVDSWRRITNISAYDYINDNVRYRATLFDTQPR